MLGFYSSASSHVNSAKAIREALAEAMDESSRPARLVIMHSTMGHDLSQLIEGAHEICPDAEVVGCTGSGAIGRDWVSEAVRSLAIMVITGEAPSRVSV
jgi:small ligand-binding sensory domain FIST